MSAPASRGRRLGAVVVDGLLVGAVLAVPEAGSQALLWIALIASQLILLTKRGQTIGKASLGLQIRRVDTDQHGGFLTNVVLRTFANGLLCFLPLYWVVDVLCIFSRDRRCLHDRIAGTYVARL